MFWFCINLHRVADAFDRVKAVGLTLPGVEVATKYDGSPLLKAGGSFMARLAMHRSAEPDTPLVRSSVEDGEWRLEDAPETYYVTDYYEKCPVVLVRLSPLNEDPERLALNLVTHGDGEGSEVIRLRRPR